MTGNDDMGLCIPYRIRVTPGKGRGVFAVSAICKGTSERMALRARAICSVRRTDALLQLTQRTRCTATPCVSSMRYRGSGFSVEKN